MDEAHVDRKDQSSDLATIVKKTPFEALRSSAEAHCMPAPMTGRRAATKLLLHAFDGATDALPFTRRRA
jgi:hypothetical protein